GGKNHAIVAIAPPRVIMPFGVITSEGGVPIAFPELGAIYIVVLLELHVLYLRVVLVRKVVVLCFYLRLVLVHLPTSVIRVAPSFSLFGVCSVIPVVTFRLACSFRFGPLRSFALSLIRRFRNSALRTLFVLLFPCLRVRREIHEGDTANQNKQYSHTFFPSELVDPYELRVIRPELS